MPLPNIRFAAPLALALILPAAGAAGEALQAPYQIEGVSIDLRGRDGRDESRVYAYVVDLDQARALRQGEADRWLEATVLTEIGAERAQLVEIRKSCEFLCGVEEEETCHHQAVVVLPQDSGANAFVAFPGTVEVTDFEMLTATPLPSSEAWSRDFHEVIWPEDDSGRIRIDGWNAKTRRLQFSMQAMGEERSFDEQACRAGTAAGLTQLACHGIAVIAADGVPLLLSVPDYNDAIASPVARFTANGETHVLVRLGLKAQTIYGLLVKRGDKWIPLFRRAERALLC
jgi:hypothetical protein